ncbi:MAG: MgtC/SapB family protein [Longimicrobiales bacterium]|nr:MgtC/SapB family protein [Longimicrobiales bacterium]
MSGVLDWLSSLTETYPELRLDLLGRLVLASILGGAIGWEREQSHKPAGLRTNILICMGATLLTDLSVRVAAQATGLGDPGRIAAQIVTGVGFLGAGTILQSRGSIMGLTTAATLWVVAAIGMAVGFAATIEAVGATFLVLVALIPLRALEERAKARQSRNSPRVTAVGEDVDA